MVTTPPRTESASGCAISSPATSPMIANGSTSASVVTDDAMMLGNCSCDAATHQLFAERLTLVQLQMLEMGDQTDALPHHQCEHRRQTQQRAKREVAVIDCGRSEAAECGDRYAEQRQGAECPAAEHRLRQQEHQHRRRRHVAVYRSQRSSLLLVFAEHLGTVLERECDLFDIPGDIVRHITERPLVHFRGNIDTTRGPLSLDDAGGRRDADVRDLEPGEPGTRSRC